MGSWSVGSVLTALCSLVALSHGAVMQMCNQPDSDNTTIYDFSFMDIMKEKTIPLSNYKGKEEPGKNGTEILNGVRWVKPGHNFVPNFQLFEKIEVNGDKEHPMYTYLKKYCPPVAEIFYNDMLFYSPIYPNDIGWNWETFLIGRDGKVKRRAPSRVEPEELEADIQSELYRWTNSIFG